MKILNGIAAALAAFSLIVILLVTAAEAAIYLDFRFYEKEYRKYGVLEELEMEMEDVMHVTREMMAYLHDRREDLKVETTVAGSQREFFNDREKAHMVDVKRIFDTAVMMRRVAVGLFLIALGVLLSCKGNWKKLIPKCYMAETALFLMGAGVIAFLFTRDFGQYFIKFHELFFSNDLWLLDPETDLMIRMLPEGFFADFAARIGIFAGAALLAMFAVSFIIFRIAKRMEEDLQIFA